MRKLLIVLLVLIALAFLGYTFSEQIMDFLFPVQHASIEGMGIKVEVTDDDSWMTVAKVVAAFLGTYLGIKIINKYVK